ncbi:MAG: molybdopterin guanine dinucleotide-containing S/N-oxide reductase [Albidovulum sp.]|nr:molybdopterin guanine dinucleotide-containing S/N-oxide reductase [Albidovulum sp.]
MIPENLKKLPLTSTHWGAYRVETENGRVKSLHAFEEDPDSSPIGNGIVDAIDGPSRIRKPSVRRSWLESGPGSSPERRGGDAFVELSWEDAEKLVAKELTRIRGEFGNQAIYAGSYGWASAGRFHHAQSQIHRFLNCFGGYTRSENTYSFAAAEVAIRHVIGGFWDYLHRSTSWPAIASGAELVVAFGGIPLKNGQINSGGIGAHLQKQGLDNAIKAGVEFVNVGPQRSDLDHSAGNCWLPIRPCTDTAMMLGIMHVLFTEKLCDHEFLKRYTTGFDQFRPYLTGEDDGAPKNAEWAAEICGVDACEIKELALRMAAKKTMISTSWSLTRQAYGEQPFWTAIALASMLGEIGLRGRGICFGYSATNSIGGHYTRVPGASLPQGENRVRDFIPVARISDMLLNPGRKFDYDGKKYRYPDIKLIYWAGGNPFHHHQDLNRMLSAWRKPETIIVHDWCWNATAKHADIVLPCTVGLERDDVAFSPRDPYAIAMEKVVEPFPESRNDFEILSGIAERLGLESEFSGGRSEAEWIRWLYEETVERSKSQGIEMPDYDAFRRSGWFKPEPPSEPVNFLSEFRQDPDTHRLETPSGRIEIFSETVASFGYSDCPGRPTWLAPREWLGDGNKKFPLHLVTNQPAAKLHSQLDQGSESGKSKVNGREPVSMHPDDAADRGLVNGDSVKVFNLRGACVASLTVTDCVRRGVVQMATGAWYDPELPGRAGSICKHGNPNVLTPDFGTSRLAQGPGANSCLVDVEKFDDPAPDITAFDPPEFVELEQPNSR